MCFFLIFSVLTVFSDLHSEHLTEIASSENIVFLAEARVSSKALELDALLFSPGLGLSVSRWMLPRQTAQLIVGLVSSLSILFFTPQLLHNIIN